MAMQAVVAKYAPYIQRLAVRSLDAFYIFQPLCRNLEAFYFRLDSYDLESVFDNAQMEQRLMEAKPSIVKFILDQPYLRSLHLSRVLMPPAELRDWILVKRPFWRHADVVLSETEYPHITSLLPVVQSCRFRIPSSSCLWTPLAEPHHHMRELDLQILGDSHYVLLWFNRVALTGIAKSFPNLRRLVIRDARGLVRLDLMMEGCTRLTIYRLPLSENNHYQKLAVRQLASILSMLPRVVALHIDRWFDEDFETVVLFCPHLMYAYASRKLDLEVITSRPSTTTTTTTTVTLPFNLPPVPPPTVQLLLAHCPDLRRVEMLDYELHLRHLARERWVCHHLQSLGCHLTGVSPVTKPTKINFPHSNAATRP
ncbi:hypothetical protein DFQ27_005912 [Actinomortierella ambigua]|uniref:F-box domain-containing protein n=1 Tax=Actinomortierella ambigua TaxID=1343610 RepID=A0A9P6U291_9FUNG|nr:hypothetical protein DFQ27_005912 [Actinomortierella ambigua]